MIHSVATALLWLGAIPQSSPAADVAWIPLDGVAAVINDEIVKESELQRELSNARERLRKPISTAAELDEFQDNVRKALVRRRLRTQAGELLGLEEENVDRMVDEHLVDQRKRRGLLSYIGDLNSKGLGEHEIHSETRRQFYEDTWENSVRGEMAAGQRPQHDRFVRPSEKYFRYKESIDAFADPPEVRLRQFVVVPSEGETEAEARARCRDLKERVERGEPLERLLLDGRIEADQTNTWSGTADRVLDPGLANFAAVVPVGTTTEVADVTPEGGKMAFMFLVLEDRQASGPPRPFLDGAVQERLERWVLETRDLERLDRGEKSLIASAYIAPPLDAPAVGDSGQR